jgi:hypothetical protein
LYWTQQSECPTEDEYLDMVGQSKFIHSVEFRLRWFSNVVSAETGGLFRLLAQLMTESAHSLHDRY